MGMGLGDWTIGIAQIGELGTPTVGKLGWAWAWLITNKSVLAH
jgi:hypothetical protein